MGLAHGIQADNEGRACDAVLRVLETREGGMRRNLRFPEDEQHEGPVELVCDIGEKSFALEHTKLESYEAQISDHVRFSELFSAIEDRLSGALPGNGWYGLSLPSEALARADPRLLKRLPSCLTDWVRSAARCLEAEPPNHRICERPRGMPFAVTLRFTPARAEDCGKLVITLAPPGQDQQGNRSQRIERALRQKLPKLATWKAHGAITVLILENADQMLGSCVAINEVVKTELGRMDGVPDEIYLVDTSSRIWVVFPLKNGATHLPEGSGGVWASYPFDPDRLNDVHPPEGGAV